MKRILMGSLVVWSCELIFKSQHWVLTMALAFEMVNNLMQIEAVPKILKTKSKSAVNVPIAASCALDALIWFLYALCVGDPIYTVLNGAGILQGALKYHLY